MQAKTHLAAVSVRFTWTCFRFRCSRIALVFLL